MSFSWKKKNVLITGMSGFFAPHIAEKLINLGVSKVDYLEIINLKKLKKPKNRKENYNIFVAYYLGKTRLIDNI